MSCSHYIDITQDMIGVIVEDASHGLIRHKDYFELLRCEQFTRLLIIRENGIGFLMCIHFLFLLPVMYVPYSTDGYCNNT